MSLHLRGDDFPQSHSLWNVSVEALFKLPMPDISASVQCLPGIWPRDMSGTSVMLHA